MNPQNIWMYSNTLGARATSGAHRQATTTSTPVVTRPTNISRRDEDSGLRWRL